VELRVMCPPTDTLELLMMGIVVPETCWASNNICNKNHLLHLVGILFPHINDDARSKSLQMRDVFTVFSWRTEISLCSLAAEKTSGCKQSAQSSLCKFPPRSRTECGIVRSSSASVRNAFLCKEPKSSCKFKKCQFWAESRCPVSYSSHEINYDRFTACVRSMAILWHSKANQFTLERLCRNYTGSQEGPFRL
jgi:hypothetical protein